MRTQTVWESYEMHSIYNCDSELTEMEEVPMLEDKFFMETFKDSYENQFDPTDGDYYTPEESVYYHDLAELAPDVLDRLREDTPRTRRWECLYLYRDLVDKAKSLAHLGYIGALTYKAVDASIKEFENDGEVYSAPTLFPAGHLVKFWAYYKAKKAKLANASSSTIQEIEDLLSANLDAQGLKALKQEIYKTKLSYNQKKDFWAKCDQQINTLAC